MIGSRLGAGRDVVRLLAGTKRQPYPTTTSAVTEDNRVMQKQLTAIIEREGDGYVALCPEVDISSQGGSIEEARENLREALELFFETASSSEIQQRLHEDVYVTRVEVAVG
jgi:predicted RNase H-like HicB family nuclease